MKALIIVMALFLAGCSTLPSSLEEFENRVVCTVDGQQAHFISKYGRMGVSAEISPTDGKVICKK